VIWRRDDPPPATGDLPAAPGDVGSDEPGETTGTRPGRMEVRGMADQQGGEVTIVGQGAKLEGTVVSAGSLRIDGQVKGQINAEGDVLLSPQSQVEADIRAQNVVVAGLVEGDIDVDGLLCVRASGRVLGNVRALRVSVDDGAVVRGRCSMGASASPQPAGGQAPFMHRMLDDDDGLIELAAHG